MLLPLLLLLLLCVLCCCCCLQQILLFVIVRFIFDACTYSFGVLSLLRSRLAYTASSMIAGMRGAKAGVSPPRRSLTCMQYDFASFGVRYEIIPVQACHIILTWRHVERCGIPDTPSRVNKHLYLYPGYLYISLPVPWVLCQGRTLLTIYSGRVLMLHMTHNMIGYVFV